MQGDEGCFALLQVEVFQVVGDVVAALGRGKLRGEVEGLQQGFAVEGDADAAERDGLGRGDGEVVGRADADVERGAVEGAGQFRLRDKGFAPGEGDRADAQAGDAGGGIAGGDGGRLQVDTHRLLQIKGAEQGIAVAIDGGGGLGELEHVAFVPAFEIGGDGQRTEVDREVGFQRGHDLRLQLRGERHGGRLL